MSRNPEYITLADLIRLQEFRIKRNQVRLPHLVLIGRMTDFAAKKTMACDRELLKLLKKYQRNPQINLFEELSKSQRP